MTSNEKLVSPYIAAQFPAHYREDNPQLVEFAKMYYQWLESEDQAVGRAKRIAEYRDIDETLEDFIVYFKNKQLPLLKFDTATDKRMIIKHVLDLYRSKGTERGIDLFFRLVYGMPAEVYYPSTDIFKLSDNTWVRRSYLELSQHPSLSGFPGNKVIGKRSGATAFAEKYVTKKVGNRYAYIIYISDIVGNFETGEQVYYDGITTDTFPFVTGSMNTLDVTSGSVGFSIGDIVTVESSSGSGGQARVSAIANTTGIVDFQLIDGGWGYTACSVVYVSEKVMSVTNLNPDTSINNTQNPAYSNAAFFFLENVTQPMANLDYTNATGNVEAGNILRSYYSNGSVASQVVVLAATSVNSTVGNCQVSLVSGNSQVNTYFWAPSNAYSINVQTYTDVSASGKFIGIANTQTLYVSNSVTRFTTNNYVYQVDANNKTSALARITSTEYNGTSAVIRVGDIVGPFDPLKTVYMRFSNGVNASINAWLTEVSTVIGVSNVTGTFVYSQNAYIKTDQSNSTANVTFINGGQFATFDISNTFSYSDTYDIYTDFLRSNSTLNVAFMSTLIDAVDYGFPKATGGSDLTTVIGDALDSFSAIVGTITGLTNVNPGKEYDAAPFVFIYDPYTSGYQKKDYTLTVNLTSSNFSAGEEVTQDNGAKGVIKEVVNTSTLSVRRTSLYTDFDKNYSNTTIAGTSSGATAALVSVVIDQNTLPVGLDAVVSANVVTANGVVTKLEVIDSGFNYAQDETADFISEDGQRVGGAKVNLITHGTSKGTFIDESSFLSENKYLFDGYYYQEFSYDIRSGVTREKFEEIYKNTMHLAGTQMFSTFVHTSVNPLNITASLPEGANTQPV